MAVVKIAVSMLRMIAWRTSSIPATRARLAPDWPATSASSGRAMNATTMLPRSQNSRNTPRGWLGGKALTGRMKDRSRPVRRARSRAGPGLHQRVQARGHGARIRRERRAQTAEAVLAHDRLAGGSEQEGDELRRAVGMRGVREDGDGIDDGLAGKVAVLGVGDAALIER